MKKKVLRERRITINTGDPRIEAWGYKKGNILSLHIRIPSLLHTIPLGNGAEIKCTSDLFQAHDIKVRL